MKNRIAAVLLVVFAGVLASGCSVSAVPTAPSGAGGTQSMGAMTIRSLSTGNWTSLSGGAVPGGLPLDPGTCGNFKWAVTSLTLVGAAGTFSADCGGGLSLAGSATVTLNGTGAAWGANGTVTGTGTSCTFTVTGSAALESGGVRITYNANVCGTMISGSELLNKK